MKTARFHLSLVPAALVAAALPMLTGCAGMISAPSATPTTQTLAMTGSVHGGQQPVTGSQVYLYAVGSTVGGASTSLLSGTGYVTTDNGGNFSISSDYTCPAANTAVSTYLLAVGGNPGLPAQGTSNSAITLMAALGPCSNLTNLTFVEVNEVTTAATVTALQHFMVDPTHIGDLAISAQPGYSAPQGIPNAMVTANNLVDLSTGSALAAPLNGTGTSPQAKLNTLGNILSACVNAASPTDPNCVALFTAASPTGTATVSDVASAMLQIAQNPGHNVGDLFVQGAAVAPFGPALGTAPNDFSLAINYTGGLSYPGPLAVDNAGDVFVANCPSCNGGTGSDSVVGYQPSGAFQTSGTGFTTNIHKPVAIAIDRYNALWVAEAANATLGNQVTRLTYNTGTLESGFPVALNGVPGGMALVENNPSAAWITDSTNGRIVLINNDGTLIGGANTTGLSHPTAIAADGLENLFLIGTGSSTVLEYSPIYPTGSFSPSTGGNFTTLSGASAGFSAPVSLAIDGGDHLWTVDTGSTVGVSELFAPTDTATSPAGGYPGVNVATNVTIDGAGTAWIANCRNSCATSGTTAADNVVHLSATGANLNQSDGLQDESLSQPTATAIDLSGNLWISNTSGASLTELVGVAVPVVTELETASSRHALPAVNYLRNGSFEDGPTGATVPNWTVTTTVTGSTTTSVDTSSPFSGQQKLTFYNGSPYTTTESQTITGLPNGNYLVSCYIASAPGSTTRTTSLIASGYNGAATLSNSPTDLTYTFQPYSIPNVPVASGTLTVGLYNHETYSGGGYVGWDSCSVTKQ